MKTKITLLVTVLVVTLFGVGCASTKSNAETRTPESNNKTKLLYSSIVDTTWIYHWRDGDWDFSFDASGEIGQIGAEPVWKGVRWRVISPTEVLLDGKSAVMLLRFSPNLQSFNTADWDNQPASGKPKTKE